MIAGAVLVADTPAQQPATADPCAVTEPAAAPSRAERFQGTVSAVLRRCRGGDRAVRLGDGPWNDWANYYGAGDATSLGPTPEATHAGIIGALEDLERQKLDLFAFNLYDNNGTYEAYAGPNGRQIRVWPQLQLPGGAECRGALARARTLTGICNDVRNGLMGSTGTVFASNADFEDQFPDRGLNEITRNRHGGRIGLLTPDPQRISRALFTRQQSDPAACRDGHGLPGNAPAANCDYKKAPFLNVLAAFWIQFMTHDWFSHMEEGHNDTSQFMAVGCTDPATGCRPGDRIDRAYVADASVPPTFPFGGRPALGRDPVLHKNLVTAWWDASQLYGYDETSARRVKRDPADRAKLLMVRVPGRTSAGDAQGYLPLLGADDPKLPDWAGQETAGFADNWTVGISFFHNVFAREHNLFVDAFRRQARATPGADSGLRDPERPDAVIHYQDVSADTLFDVARLVVSAEIAKIHTIDWTTQLLYDEPLYLGMNANWGGLPGREKQVPGIVGSASANHFGSPFNFPEEFISVYRLHTLVPDLLEYRRLAEPNAIAAKVPVVDTFRGKATAAMRERGLANWALSMGRQRSGTIDLQNGPVFLQNLAIARLPGTGKIDVLALDLVRDRERGVPRYNEFRRQYGLPSLQSFDELASTPAIAAEMRAIYGQHRCDASKVISTSLPNGDGTRVNDCLGHPDGSVIDNIEDVDTMVGWASEPVRPHGFAISETQFVVFILNASRRLYSDRFLTESFRPAFYSTIGLAWVNDNGPAPAIEPRPINGHTNVPVSPLKRVLARTMPELAGELAPLNSAFDPWARDPGSYYSLQWTPRPGAEGDAAFSGAARTPRTSPDSPQASRYRRTPRRPGKS
jgi:hypothetical protein